MSEGHYVKEDIIITSRELDAARGLLIYLLTSTLLVYKHNNHYLILLSCPSHTHPLTQ